MSQHRTCVDCGQGFTLSYEEQRWYQEQGWALPKRCEECRSRRRRERDSGNMGLAGPVSQPSGRSPRWPAEFFDQARAGQPGRRPPQARPSRRILTWWGNPYARFGLLSLGLVLLTGVAALWWIDWPWGLILMVVAVNVITLALYRYDKAIAGGEQTRVPNAILLALAFCGGSPAAYLATYGFRQRHKVRKLSFVLPFWLIVTGQILALCGLLSWRGWF